MDDFVPLCALCELKGGTLAERDVNGPYNVFGVSMCSDHMKQVMAAINQSYRFGYENNPQITIAKFMALIDRDRRLAENEKRKAELHASTGS